jgi:hypothetical protein
MEENMKKHIEAGIKSAQCLLNYKLFKKIERGTTYSYQRNPQRLMAFKIELTC